MEFIDLTGQKFNFLTAIRYLGKIKDNQQKYWLFQCDCGKQIETLAASVKDEKTKSCGCKRKVHKLFVDLMGKSFSNLTVVGRKKLKNQKYAQWECKCVCGNIVYRESHKLTTNFSKHCGCKSYESRTIDISGKRFGHLVAIKYAPKIDRDGLPSWLVKCDCGKDVVVDSWKLRKGNIISCGCIERRTRGFIDIPIGKKFGYLTVIKYFSAKQRNGKVGKWFCQCECGKKTYVDGGSLRDGSTQSCGCYKAECLSEATWKGHEEISGTTWGLIRSGAEKRDIPFSITIKQAWDQFVKQNKICAFTGIFLTFQSSHLVRDGTASLDRIDNTKGYTTDNIQWIHKDLNWMKGTFVEQTFFNWIKMIYEYKFKNPTDQKIDGVMIPHSLT